jgi:single-stranded DNA-binding protein
VIDALVAGRLHGKPVERTAKNGARFATCNLRVVTREGEALFANVICFQASAVTALLALNDDDAVAIAGELTPKVWTDRGGTARPALDLTAHSVLSPYRMQRKRQAISDADGGRREAPRSVQAPAAREDAG